MLKLKVGKFYKSASGNKVEIIRELESSSKDHKFFVGIYNLFIDSQTAFVYNEDGTRNGCGSDQFTITEEWKDLVDMDIWLIPKDLKKALKGAPYYYGQYFCLEKPSNDLYKKYRLTEIVE
jgi:hypothetical protein